MCSCHGPHHRNCHHQPGNKPERFIQPSLLLCLAEKSSYGYELIEQLSGFRLHSGSPDPGAVYRHLRRLEMEGYVESHWKTGEAGPAKRMYAMTAAGISLLHAWAGELGERKAALEEFLERYLILNEKQ